MTSTSTNIEVPLTPQDGCTIIQQQQCVEEIDNKYPVMTGPINNTETPFISDSQLQELQEQQEQQEQQQLKLQSAEQSIRIKAKHSYMYLFFINTYSTILIFIHYLISVECIVSIVLSVGLTIYLYFLIINRYYDEDDTTSVMQQHRFDGSIMSWILLTFAVITPITTSVTMAFRRRENAIQYIATIKSLFLSVYSSHAIWDWEYKTDSITGICTTGRERSSINWLQHSDNVAMEIFCLCSELTRYLTMPCSTRARHRVSASGKAEAHNINEINVQLKLKIVTRYGTLAQLCEIMKQDGFPGNEAARVRQFENGIITGIDQLCTIKYYRTPQGLRSFSRIFSMFLPPFFAPYYVQIAIDVQSLGLAIAFAIVTSFALTSLFETINQLEDPFGSKHAENLLLDGIDVQSELETCIKLEILTLRKHYFPTASPFIYKDKSR